MRDLRIEVASSRLSLLGTDEAEGERWWRDGAVK